VKAATKIIWFVAADHFREHRQDKNRPPGFSDERFFFTN
jgi:hypothetical protein